MHLFLIVNGLFGTVNNMKTTTERIELYLQETGIKHICHVAESNQKFQTFDGIEVCGYRLFNELLTVLNTYPEINEISLIGYSMGGLIIRYLAGLMYKHNMFSKITPINFMTIATPHLGTYMWKPTLSVKFWNLMGLTLLGPSGVDLMSTGNSLLDKMSDLDSCYMKSLKKFKKLSLIANAVGDRSVNFWTSYITLKHPFPTRNRRNLQHTMYTLGSERHVKFLVNMQQPIKQLKPDPPQHNTKSSMNIFIILFPIFALFLLIVSVFKFFSSFFVLLVYKFKVNHHTKKTGNLKQDLGTNNVEITETIRTTYETQSLEQAPEADDVVNLPKPVVQNRSRLIDACTNEIKVTKAVRKRMENLNTLPWNKWVAYLHHHRTHAFIIDRLHEGDSEAIDLLDFLASQLSTSA